MKEIITSFGFTIWEWLAAAAAGVLALLVVVAFSKNLPDMGHNYLIGLGFKLKKNYKARDIIRINDKRWYIDHLNSIDIKFLIVVTWQPGAETITLGAEELVWTYHEFQRSKRIRLGSFT